MLSLKNAYCRHPPRRCAFTNSENYAEKGNQLSVEQIDAIFEKLSPLAAVDESVKQQHIKNINEKYKQSAKAKPVEPVAVDDPNQVSNDVS